MDQVSTGCWSYATNGSFSAGGVLLLFRKIQWLVCDTMAVSGGAVAVVGIDAVDVSCGLIADSFLAPKQTAKDSVRVRSESQNAACCNLAA